MYEKGGELSNWGALRNLPQEASGQQAPPFFPINRGGRCFKFSWPLGYAFWLFWIKKNTFLWRKIMSKCFRNASKTFLWTNLWWFSSVLHFSLSILHSFFVLQPISVRIRDFQFISFLVLLILFKWLIINVSYYLLYLYSNHLN